MAMLAVLAHFSSGAWPVLLGIAGVIRLILCHLPDITTRNQNRAWAIARLVGIYLMTGELLPHAAAYWPGKWSDVVIPTSLFALSLYGQKKRPDRVAGVLWNTVVLLGIPICIAACRAVRLEWVLPDKLSLSGWVIPALLLPLLTKEKGEQILPSRWYAGVAAAAIGIWCVVNGVLSQHVAADSAAPIGLMGQSVGNGGVNCALRVWMTILWFGFTSYMIQRANSLWNVLYVEEKRKMLWNEIFLLTMVGIGDRMCKVITIVLVLCLWLVLPQISRKIISKKDEKST